MRFKYSFPYYLLMSLFIFNFQSSAQDTPTFRIGINFPFRNPETASLSTYLNLLNEIPARGMRQMTFADVFWGSVEPEDNQWDFTLPDSAIINPYNIHTVQTLFTMGSNVNDVGLQVPWKACDQPGCGWDAASDSNETRDYVQTVVNRYKTYTRYWEIANEMDGNKSRPSGLPAADFADFLNYVYSWIKQADPEAKVLLPGMLGTYGLPVENARGWLREVLKAGGGKGFDIVNYHDYNSWWTLPVHYDSLKALMDSFGMGDKPVWVTECSVSSDNSTDITPAYASEEEQAADVWRRSAILFGKGVQTGFWHSHWSSGGNSSWREFGILNAKGERKKAWYAYRLLIEKIEGFENAALLSQGQANDDNTQGGGGTWITRYDFNDGRQCWVMWNPDGGSYSLAVDNGTQAVVTEVVPATISSDRMSATFNISTLQPENGAVNIPLSGYPVLVETESANPVAEFSAGPGGFKLKANYPNPFNPATQIPYSIFRAGTTELSIYNVNGKKVATLVDGFQAAGTYRVTWDGRDFRGHSVPSGIYWYRLETAAGSATRSMLLLK